jgi:hypothetical protein
MESTRLIIAHLIASHRLETHFAPNFLIHLHPIERLAAGNFFLLLPTNCVTFAFIVVVDLVAIETRTLLEPLSAC